MRTADWRRWLGALAALLPAAAGFCAPATAVAAGSSRSSSLPLLPLLRAPGHRTGGASRPGVAGMRGGEGGDFAAGRQLIRVVGAVVLRGGRVFMAQRPLHKVRPALVCAERRTGPALGLRADYDMPQACHTHAEPGPAGCALRILLVSPNAAGAWRPLGVPGRQSRSR